MTTSSTFKITTIHMRVQRILLYAQYLVLGYTRTTRVSILKEAKELILVRRQYKNTTCNTVTYTHKT